MTGYLHPDYAASFAAFGEPLALPQSRGHLVRRSVAGGDRHDAMGPYPLFCCADWAALPADLAALGNRLIAVGLVTDPFAALTEEFLKGAFQRVVPFKEHFISDLESPVEKLASKHHRYYARKAFDAVTVEVAAEPLAHLDEWVTLYGNLAAKHGIRGLRAFSRDAFARQLGVPGLTLVRAHQNGVGVATHLFYTQGDVAYSHLAASSDEGYAVNAMYGIYYRSLEHFAGRVRSVDWGAGAGLSKDGSDGLSRFKRGWSTRTLPVWFCGSVLDAAAYDTAVQARGNPATNFFPAYRLGEF